MCRRRVADKCQPEPDNQPRKNTRAKEQAQRQRPVRSNPRAGIKLKRTAAIYRGRFAYKIDPPKDGFAVANNQRSSAI
jgi:hypothetical protein